MCTVTFYKDNNRLIVTSNRDEDIDRPSAIGPQSEYVNGTKLFFPKDPKAGGSWFAVNEKGGVFVLLNGAEFKHDPKPPYEKSRGIVLVNIASALSFEIEWNSIELVNIEPFTIVVYFDNKLVQLRWDGVQKEMKKINELGPKIWSSSTLYEPSVILKRSIWFDEFISEKNNQFVPEDLVDFHSNTKQADLENGLVINRNWKMLTKNITQFVLEKNQFTLLHIDLLKKSKSILVEKIA